MNTKYENTDRQRLIGVPSVILILTVISMVAFSLLALKSSLNERAMAMKTADSVSEYYGLCTKAEQEIKNKHEQNIKDNRTGSIYSFSVVSDTNPDMYIAVRMEFSDESAEDYKLSEYRLVYDNRDLNYGFEIPVN